MGNYLSIIKKEKWDFGTRIGTPIFVYDLICNGVDKYIRKTYGEEFRQMRALVPKNGDVVRAIGIRQENKIYNFFKKILLKDPEFLARTIFLDEKALACLEDKAKNLKDKNDFIALLELFKKHSFYFFVGLSCGIQLFENKDKIRRENREIIKKTLAVHDVWRNSILPREIKIFDRMDVFLKKVAARLKIKNFADLYFLKVSEIKNILNDGNLVNADQVRKKIEKRKGYGFIYLFLLGKAVVINGDKSQFKEIKNFFDKKLEKENDKSAIKGMVAYRDNKNKIRGVVKTIEQPDLKPIKLDGEIAKNTILVAQQTDPRYLPIVNKFFAIITDDGGITCHAAIIAREFKIPCIVGAKIATQVLKDGDLVEMDMGTGMVGILKK